MNTIETLSPQVRRIVALGLLAALLLAAYALVISPLVDGWVGLARSIDETRELASGYERSIRAKSRIAAELEALRGERPDPSWFVTGETDALAAAELQNHATELVSAAGAGMRSIQPLPAEDEDGLKRVTLIVEIEATTTSLTRLVYALEAETPYLFIDQLQASSRIGTPEEPESAPMLDVRLTIYGYATPIGS